MYTREIRNFLKDRTPPVPDNIDEIDIVYICYLPFRLQIGKIIKYDCSFGGNSIDIWVFNEIPENPSIPEDLDIFGSDINFAKLTSKLMIHMKNPKIKQEDFDKIVETIRKGEQKSTTTIQNIFKASIALNRLLIAFNGVNHNLITGDDFRKITNYDLLIEGLLVKEDIIIGDSNFSFSEDEVESILGTIPTMNETMSRWTGLDVQVDDTMKEKVQVFINKYIDQMLLYDMLFEAKTKIKTDPRGALIQVVMAFENAISLLLEFEFEKRFIIIQNATQDVSEKAILTNNYLEDIIDDFRRKLGLTCLTHTFPIIFSNNNDILKPSEIKKAVSAISTRNKLVHSKKTRSDEYFWSDSKQEDLRTHYSTMYKLTQKLAEFIIKRIDEKHSENTSRVSD